MFGESKTGECKDKAGGVGFGEEVDKVGGVRFGDEVDKAGGVGFGEEAETTLGKCEMDSGASCGRVVGLGSGRSTISSYMFSEILRIV